MELHPDRAPVYARRARHGNPWRAACGRLGRQKRRAREGPFDMRHAGLRQKLLPTVANTVALLPPTCCTVAVAPMLASRPSSLVRAPITIVVELVSYDSPGTEDSSEPGIDCALAKTCSSAYSNRPE